MALLDSEGFDRETNLALSNWFSHGVGSGTVSADNAGALGYGRAVLVPYGNGRTFANTQTFWFQCHFYVSGAPGGDWAFKFLDGASTQFLVGFEANLRVKAWVNGGSTASASPVITLNAWNFIQLRIHIAAVGGYCEVWVNGVLQHTFSGDTQLTANAYCNGWGVQNAGTDRHDNILVYDETGEQPNARTSETRIYSDVPTGDDESNWTPLAGANFENVDEQPNDGDTSYVSTAGTVTDIYDYPTAVPAGNVVYGVAVEFVARKDDGGTNTVAPIVEVDGVQYAGTTVGLTVSYQRFKYTWTLNPATGVPWTVAEANAAKCGVQRIS